MNRWKNGVYVFACVTMCLVGAARASVTSTFDNDAEGWLVVGTPLGYQLPVSGGVSPVWTAGTIYTADAYPETFFSAPTKFLGDSSAALGQSLYFDIWITYSDGVAYPAAILEGCGKVLYYTIAPTPVNTWTTRAIPLSPSGWKVNNWKGPDASLADLADVLGKLRGLYILAEWKTGSDATYLDNVVWPIDPVHPVYRADYDADADVDLRDFSHFQECFNGPNQTPTQSGCADADFDCDGDVDLVDFSRFQACFNGPNQPPSCP